MPVMVFVNDCLKFLPGLGIRENTGVVLPVLAFSCLYLFGLVLSILQNGSSFCRHCMLLLICRTLFPSSRDSFFFCRVAVIYLYLCGTFIDDTPNNVLLSRN